MLSIYHGALFIHIVAGLVGLVAFWTPAIARKGGTIHVRAGRIFFRATSVVALTGLVMALGFLFAPLTVKPLASTVPPERAAAIALRIRLTAPFLLFLLLITFGPVYHGVRVLETRHDPATLRTRFHTLLNVTTIAAAAAMIVLAIWLRQPVFAALSPVGFLVGLGNLGFARKPYASRMAWWYEHMGSMLGGGIAFHTAFLVLGAGRLSGVQLNGFAAVVPWVLPTLVGIPASAIWTAHYRRKFGEDGRRPVAVAQPQP
jgi:hypothetical protein